MESCTLSDLRETCRAYGAEFRAGFVTDATTGVHALDRFINDKARKVRSWVLSRSGGRSFWSLRETFALVSGTQAYKIDGTDVTNGTDNQVDSLGDINLQWSADSIERVDQVPDPIWERINGGTWAQLGVKAYRLGATYSGGVWSQTLQFAPKPTSTTTVIIEYVPSFRNMTATTDAIVGPEGMREAIGCEVAIQLKGMQHEDASYLQSQLVDLRDQMQSAINQRIANYGPCVVDVHPERRIHFDPDRDLPPA